MLIPCSGNSLIEVCSILHWCKFVSTSVNNYIIVEYGNEFATYIKYKHKSICFRCNKTFSSAVDLREHKREHHSY